MMTQWFGVGTSRQHRHLYFLFERFLAPWARPHGKGGAFRIVKEWFADARKIILLFSVPLNIHNKNLDQYNGIMAAWSLNVQCIQNKRTYKNFPPFCESFYIVNPFFVCVAQKKNLRTFFFLFCKATQCETARTRLAIRDHTDCHSLTCMCN